MKIRFLSLIVISMTIAFSCTGTGWTKTMKGVDFPEKISIGDNTLTLNGVGMRKKLIINVYMGALYLATPTKDYDTIITSDQPKRIKMHFLYSEVSPEQLVEAWNEGFTKNSPELLNSLRNDIAAFNGWFSEPVKKNDTIVVTYLPGTGTEVMINDVVKGTIKGEDFMRAVFSIWFGKYPPSNGLKEGMAGE